MSIEIVKKDSELLLDITKKYLDLLEDDEDSPKRKKMEKYIHSLLTNIEQNIKENVKRSNEASQGAS
jgi:phosphatidylethanolamine-binding protein (PEBP) family uncharacterized protein